MPLAVLGFVGLLLLASAVALATQVSGFDLSVAAVFATMVGAAVAFVVLAVWGARRNVSTRRAVEEAVERREVWSRAARAWATEGRGDELRRADLRGAELSGADLQGADLREADLSADRPTKS